MHLGSWQRFLPFLDPVPESWAAHLQTIINKLIKRRALLHKPLLPRRGDPLPLRPDIVNERDIALLVESDEKPRHSGHDQTLGAKHSDALAIGEHRFYARGYFCRERFAFFLGSG